MILGMGVGRIRGVGMLVGWGEGVGLASRTGVGSGSAVGGIWVDAGLGVTMTGVASGVGSEVGRALGLY